MESYKKRRKKAATRRKLWHTKNVTAFKTHDTCSACRRFTKSNRHSSSYKKPCVYKRDYPSNRRTAACSRRSTFRRKSSAHTKSNSSLNSRNSSAKSSTNSRENDRGPIENLLLYYLSALRNYFTTNKYEEEYHPEPEARERRDEMFRRTNGGDSKLKALKYITTEDEPMPDRYSSKNYTILNQNRSKSDATMMSNRNDFFANKKRAYDFVNKAVTYGVDHGIVSKSGKYFWFKWNDKIKHGSNHIRRKYGCKKRKRPTKRGHFTKSRRN